MGPKVKPPHVRLHVAYRWDQSVAVDPEPKRGGRTGAIRVAARSLAHLAREEFDEAVAAAKRALAQILAPLKRGAFSPQGLQSAATNQVRRKQSVKHSASSPP